MGLQVFCVLKCTGFVVCHKIEILSLAPRLELPLVVDCVVNFGMLPFALDKLHGASFHAKTIEAIRIENSQVQSHLIAVHKIFHLAADAASVVACIRQTLVFCQFGHRVRNDLKLEFATGKTVEGPFVVVVALA